MATHPALAADTVYDSGSTTISTAVSTAAPSDSFIVGNTGTAEVNVTNPGSMTSQYDFIIANAADSTGTVTTTGAVSLSANRFFVGLSGDGTLTVNDGGTVTASGVDGVVSVGTSGGSGTLNLLGASTSLTASELRIGWADGATGTMTVSDGASVTIPIRDVTLGENAYTSGTLTITGAGSSLTATDSGYGRLTIGNQGTGTLNVLDGASASARLTYLGWNAYATGTATVSGSGSSLDTNYLGVAYGGHGTMTIADGATATVANNVDVGALATAYGDLTVTGAGTRLTTNVMNVGLAGTGEMTVADGATVDITTDVHIGKDSGSVGTLTLTGSGSSMTSHRLYVALVGNGTLNILDGASYTTSGTDLVYLGSTAATTGTVTVSGNGSSLTTRVVTVGYNGTGIMTIADGATTTADQVDLGYGPGSGSLTVTGSGSKLVTDVVNLGMSGTGALTVANGGTVSVDNGSGTINVASGAASTAALNIGAAQGSAAASAGTIDAATIAFGSGAGTIVFNHTDADYVFGSAVTGTGTLKSLAGVTSLTGDYSAFLGDVTVDGGLLSVDTDSFEHNAFTVNGGTLRVTGAVSGATETVTMNGGALVNTGTISGTTSGVVLATSGNTLSTSGAINGGTASILYSTGGNTLTVLHGASFGSVIDYNNTTGNTTAFGGGSYTIPVAQYLSASNTVQLNNSRQAVLYSNTASGSGSITVADAGANASMAKSLQTVTASVGSVLTDILSINVDRSGAAVPGSGFGGQVGEAQGDGDQVEYTMASGMGLDRYGNLFWSRVFGGETVDSYSKTSARHYGAAMGLDHDFGSTRLGVMTGYGNLSNKADDGTSRIDGDTAFGGVYVRQQIDAYALDATMIGGGIFSETKRKVNGSTERARGEFDGWFVSPEVALSRDYGLTSGWVMTPKGTLSYTHGAFDGYTETGSSMNMTYDDRTTDAVQGAFEVKLSTERELENGQIATFSLTGTVLDTYNMGDSELNASLQGTDFTVSSMGKRNVVGGRLGFTAGLKLDPQTTLFAGLTGGRYSDDSRDFVATGGLAIKF